MDQSSIEATRILPPASDEVFIDKFSRSANSSDFSVKDFSDNADFEFARGAYPLVSTNVMISYLVCVNGIGLILNLYIIADVFKKNANGLHSLLAQMAASDILMLTIVAVPEMWSHNTRSWNFGPEMCIVYLGFEVFAVTSAVYFLIAICFYSIATANLVLNLKTKGKKEAEEELLEDMTEMKSSRHSLVSRSESAAAAKAAETEKDKATSVPVIFPAVVIWILSASLSVPEFALATTIDVRSGPSICTFADGYYLSSMRKLLCIFQLLVPLLVLAVSTAVAVYKLCEIKKKEFQEDSVHDSTRALRLSLFLCCSYLVLNVPRSALSGAHLLLREGGGEGEELAPFKTPPLHHPLAPAYVPFGVSFVHFLASAVKPIVYIYFTKNPKRPIFSTFVRYKKTNQEHES